MLSSALIKQTMFKRQRIKRESTWIFNLSPGKGHPQRASGTTVKFE
jgi:hypothetical protein